MVEVLGHTHPGVGRQRHGSARQAVSHLLISRLAGSQTTMRLPFTPDMSIVGPPMSVIPSTESSVAPDLWISARSG